MVHAPFRPLGQEKGKNAAKPPLLDDEQRLPATAALLRF
jgi:hypothetical protein